MTRLRVAVAVLAALACLVTGCASTSSTASDVTPSAATFVGFPLDVPIERPHAQLVDDTGQPYDVWKRTKGEVTMLYVGYTHCPDLCPMTLATIARALDRLPAADRHKVATLFVTADPARDTPARLHEWLGRFSPDIRGLTGSPAQLRAVYTALGMPPPAVSSGDPDSIEHAASVYLFGHDDVARLAYDPTVTVSGLAADLEQVLAGHKPQPVDDSTLLATGGTGRLGLLRVVGAFLDTAPGGTAHLTLTMGSDSADGDTLQQVSGPGGSPGQLQLDGHSVATIAVPGEGKGPLVLSGTSGVLLHLPATATRQQAVDVRLTFADGGTMLVRVPIRPERHSGP